MLSGVLLQQRRNMRCCMGCWWPPQHTAWLLLAVTRHNTLHPMLMPEMPLALRRMYATAAARGDGLLLLCGGRDASGTPLGDAYGFARHRDGRWEWHAAPGAMPTGRYQHGAVFVGNRLHISGGAVGGGRMVGLKCRRGRCMVSCKRTQRRHGTYGGEQHAV